MNRIRTFLLTTLVATTALAPVRPAAASPVPQPPEWRRVEVEGTSLACVERGTGEPVVLVHGSLGDFRSWRPHVQALSRDFRVIAYSRRHHHPNPGPAAGAEAEYSVARDVRDLDSLIRVLDLGAVHLVGHGRGAEVCARFAVEHPQAVRSLVLCEPTLTGMIADAEAAAAFTMARNETRQRVRLALRDGFPDVALRAFLDGTHGGIRVEDLPDSVLGRARANLEPLRLEMNSPAAAAFGCENAKSIAAPVLLVNGGRSLPAMRIIAESFAACRPGTERVVLERAAHDVPREAAGGFARSVSRFLARTGPHTAPIAGE